ncbi:hypothetical protein I545_5102 [Mycobacterium kansasii 662]|uniref:Uncharacterized protein n=1 Tax=Mycobacterium kansasii 662 TaxID=1299326 RepID=X7Z1T0_MYCKA|nr:hypothetical protein I547_2821 [Mycobacterium kansasii 824]EUA12615.1 hypothetical protein I545_5102 [Mycobacterium kansasii 662]KEP38887.1 hypothetical protein MKSMC1_58720 [Mycobacterium kansasii]
MTRCTSATTREPARWMSAEPVPVGGETAGNLGATEVRL